MAGIVRPAVSDVERGGRGGRATYPVLEVADFPAEGVAVRGEHVDEGIKPAGELGVADAERLLERDDARPARVQQLPARQQARRVHLVVLARDRVRRREELARRRQVQDVAAQLRRAVEAPLVHVVRRQLVQRRAREVRPPRRARVRVEVEAPGHLQPGHFGAARGAARAADWWGVSGMRNLGWGGGLTGVAVRVLLAWQALGLGSRRGPGGRCADRSGCRGHC